MLLWTIDPLANKRFVESPDRSLFQSVDESVLLVTLVFLLLFLCSSNIVPTTHRTNRQLDEFIFFDFLTLNNHQTISCFNSHYLSFRFTRFEELSPRTYFNAHVVKVFVKSKKKLKIENFLSPPYNVPLFARLLPWESIVCILHSECISFWHVLNTLSSKSQHFFIPQQSLLYGKAKWFIAIGDFGSFWSARFNGA